VAPSDFHLFGPLKEALGGRRFRADNEVNNEGARAMTTVYRGAWRMYI